MLAPEVCVLGDRSRGPVGVARMLPSESLLFFLDVRIWLSIMRTSSSAAVLEFRRSGAGRERQRVLRVLLFRVFGGAAQKKIREMLDRVM